ncbi:hypothetical protein ZIOFF_046107 [Zingiber officinale]|uniref:Proteasome subunit beta n=2 Tax=Zingiber officinale TaxID=94328 RepID=A0A8J5G0F0_ZINOF|nr:hypothetical protein ZIOFF_046107 [Zingiber officinale]
MPAGNEARPGKKATSSPSFVGDSGGLLPKSEYSPSHFSLSNTSPSLDPLPDRLRPFLLACSPMSIFEYNGSAVVAMVGKNCFAIASDRRLGVNLQTIATDFQRIYKIHDKLYIGLSGLATDAQTLYQRLVFRHKLYQLREERDMKPETFASLVSALLYEKRFGPYFCQPVIAGLDDDDVPFICTMDCLGAKELAKDFVVSGTASESLYGVCESMYKPNMESEELFETISQALLSSVDRDCLSGWGGHVLLVTPTEVVERTLKGRMD